MSIPFFIPLTYRIFSEEPGGSRVGLLLAMERAPGLRLLDPDHTGDARLESVHLCGRPARFDLEDKMLVPFSILVLASHLVIAIAHDVPKFDIARGCRIDSAAAFDPNASMNGTIKRCMDDKQKAKDQQHSGRVSLGLIG